MPLWHLSEQTEDKVQDDGEHNADYDAGSYGEEELKASLVYKYAAEKSSQEGNSLPEEQQRTEEDQKGSADNTLPLRANE